MNRILVGLDSSPRAEGVLVVATQIALSTGAKLVLFRAVGVPHEIPSEAFTMAPAAVADLLQREAKADLERTAGTLPKGMVLETVVDVGTPWQGICSAADRHEADLVVIGSHGYAGLDKLVGTTAGKVVNHAKQSVLVVRGQPGFGPPQ